MKKSFRSERRAFPPDLRRRNSPELALAAFLLLDSRKNHTTRPRKHFFNGLLGPEEVTALEVSATRASLPLDRVVLPAPCSFKNRFGMFFERRSLYLFGGNKSLGQHDFEPENFARDAWRLDLGSLQWTPLADFPAARQTMSAGLDAKGQLGLAAGGFGHDGENAVTQGTSFVYDFEFDTWDKGPALVDTRSQFGLVRRGEEWFAFGGLDFDPTRGREGMFERRTDVLRWDGKGDSFVDSGIVLPRSRRSFGGDMTDGFQAVTEVDVFDFKTRSWSTVAGPSAPRFGASLVELDGALYLVGGSSPTEDPRSPAPNRSLERFDPATGTWSTLVERLPLDLTHARVLAVDGRLCIVSLHREGAGRVELTYIDPRSL